MSQEPIPSTLYYHTPTPEGVTWRREADTLYVELPPPERRDLLTGPIVGLCIVGFIAIAYLFGLATWAWQLIFDPSEAAKLETGPAIIIVGLSIVFTVFAVRRIARVRQLLATATTPSVIEVAGDRLSVSCPHAARVLRFSCPRSDVTDIGFGIARVFIRMTIETTENYAVDCFISTAKPELAQPLEVELRTLLKLQLLNDTPAGRTDH